MENPNGESVINYDIIEDEETPQAVRIAEYFKRLGIKSVIDVGCGPGNYVTALNEVGIDAHGVDVDERCLKTPNCEVCDVVSEKAKIQASMVLSLEVGEHLKEKDSLPYVRYLADCDPEILVFSAARPGQGGTGHINCQPKEYWKERVENVGFVYDDQATKEFVGFLQEGYHMGWLVNNAMIFKRKKTKTKQLVIAHFDEDLSWVKDVPKDWDVKIYSKETKEQTGLRNMGREASTYLHHVIENYDNLADETVFCQGNPFDHCRDFPKCLNSTMISFGSIFNYKSKTGFGAPKENLELFCKTFDLPTSEDFFCSNGSQYRVKKEQILRHDLSFYRKLLDKCYRDMNAPYILEYLWPVIWDIKMPTRLRIAAKNTPTLHLLGLFHTICNDDYSHCAFTGKVFKFPKMMQDEGWRVIEYSNGESQSACYEKIRILEQEQLENLTGKRKSSDFHGDIAVVGSPHHTEFSKILKKKLFENVEDGDIICHPFGLSHSDLLSIFPNSFHVETGIGYPNLVKDTHKIFESQAWRHYHMGLENRSGNNYEWVIPNYFDEDEWEVNLEPGKYVAFLGRVCDVKGMATVSEIAKRIDVPVVICGQGDISPWMGPNMDFRGPITGKQRSEFLRNAICTLMPTNYIEPFGGVFAESNFCGTPVIATSWGVFPEVLQQGVNGFCCQTLREWLDAVEICKTIDRGAVSQHARERYSFKAVGPMYTRAFKQLYNLRGAGWYTDC